MSTNNPHAEVSIKTAENLRTVAQSAGLQELSRLSLPEIDAVVGLVSNLVPAGNVPGVILSGLARLSGRRPPPDKMRRDIALLFRGVEQVLDKAIYTSVFAGPAAVIWGYQNLLKLAGKDINTAFPEGTWQFYVDYALREDTARHANETHGYDTVLNQHRISLSSVDRMTAWAMAGIHALHQYPQLLENEWRERVYPQVLTNLAQTDEERINSAQIYRDWEKKRPYSRGHDASADESYPLYRRNRFDRFFQETTRGLPSELIDNWQEKITILETTDLPAYQQQMTILAYLDPGQYGENRTAIPLAQTHIGIIYRGQYHFIPICASGTLNPIGVNDVRSQVAALVGMPTDLPPAQLTSLATLRRTAFAHLRDKLSASLVQELDALRVTPILFNFDKRAPNQPLAELRQAERGIGDHALSIFDTGQTFVFDQSHIFFDGAWGSAFAEILTNEALAWAVYLNTLTPATPARKHPYSPQFQLSASEQTLVAQAQHAIREASAEIDVVNLKALLSLRKLFRSRNDLIQLTVNDLLVLYRAIHAVTYRASPELIEELQTLDNQKTSHKAASAALDALRDSRQSPAILIPMDASQRSPCERLYPMTFEVPLDELDLLGLHERTLEALNEYKSTTGNRASTYAQFDDLQRTYLAILAGFGTVLSRAKDIAIAGESVSVGTIKLLAHMPTALQRLLDQVPGKFDFLNDIIKGQEVFSNIGAVAPTSTLTRFITAKDDNEKKTLAWGIISDAKGVMRISLRDFRPHVGLFEAIGRKDVATRITQDYLEAYAGGLNRYVQALQRITLASRETRLAKPEEFE